MPDAYLQQLYDERRAIDAAIAEVLADNLTSGAVDGVSAQRLTPAELRRERGRVNRDIIRRKAELAGQADGSPFPDPVWGSVIVASETKPDYVP